MASPGSVYSTDASPHRALRALGGIFVRCRISRRGSCSSRCRLLLPSAAVFRRDSFGCECRRAQHDQLSSPPGLHAGLRDRPLSLAADPLRLQAGGAEPDLATSDVPCRTVAACAWAPSLAFAASPPVFRQATRHWPRHQDLNDATRLKETPSRAQDAFRRLRSRSCDRVKHLRDPCYVRAGRLAPVRPEPPSLPSSRGSGHFVTSPRRLGSPRGSPRQPGHGASHRPLQPTFDTSTRRPLDFRARG